MIGTKRIVDTYAVPTYKYDLIASELQLKDL